MRADGSGRRSDTAGASGNLLGQVLYYPFGDTRVVNGSTATTFRYTGQRQENRNWAVFLRRTLV